MKHPKIPNYQNAQLVMLLMTYNYKIIASKNWKCSYRLCDDDITISIPICIIRVISKKEDPKIPSMSVIGHRACNIELNVDFDYCLQIDDIIIT